MPGLIIWSLLVWWYRYSLMKKYLVAVKTYKQVTGTPVITCPSNQFLVLHKTIPRNHAMSTVQTLLGLCHAGASQPWEASSSESVEEHVTA